jgi:hypothetical protein
MLNLTGLYFPRLDREGNLDLALEWVRTNHITYRHGTFTSGYVYKNRILGHPIGPDGTGLYLILRHFRTSAIQTRLTAAFEIRGKSGEDGGGVPYPPSRFEKAEQRYRWTAEGTYRVSRQTSLMPVIGVERVRNAAYRRGDDRWGFTAGIDFVYRL